MDVNKYIAIFQKVLEIIGYEEGQDTHTAQFLQLCLNEVLINMVQRLPQDEKEAVEEKLKQETGNAEENLQKRMAILGSYIDPQEFSQEFSGVFAKMLETYLQKILHMLTWEKKTKVQEYLTTVGVLVNF